MNHDSEKEFLDRSLGPAFYPMLERHRQRQTDFIHAWLRDAVYTTLLDPHQSGCDCLLHDLDDVRPYSLAAALTMTVRDLVNEAAATGVDVVQFMGRHTPEEFGQRALRHSSFQGHVEGHRAGVRTAEWRSHDPDADSRTIRDEECLMRPC
jgi:hypothetical protein